MANLLDLARFMEGMKAPGVRLANNKAIAIADAIIIDLAQNTPADVGTAVSNWQVTLDNPAPDVIDAFSPSKKGRVLKGVWVHAVDPTITIQANAPILIDNARNILQTKEPGETVYITNNLEYIQKLNQGSSLQAPAGFVERAELIAEEIIKAQSITIFGPTPFDIAI